MPQRTSSYTIAYDPVTQMYVRRGRGKRRSSRVKGLGTLGSFGQATGLKGTLGSVKGVLITGTIAAAGAIVTNQVYEKIGNSLGLEGWKRDLAKMVTGIALGLLIAKLTKKPKLAAAFAIGPVVAGVLNLFGDVMGSTAGLGLTAFNPSNVIDSMYAPFYGTGSVNTYNEFGPQAAAFMQTPTLAGNYNAMPAM